ncbi:MAG: efflux RND transporter periplasmic adaptor subunit [Bacteroidetes bacterium]|nr:efflux RND transporter periplasmic adaptor subunit [Bacteroidota bacterium]
MYRNTRFDIFSQTFLYVSLFLLFVGCDNNKIKVQLADSEIRTIYSRVSESGTIQPTVDVPVAPDVSGEVVFISIAEGQKVKKGDLLLTIRPDDYRAQLEQSEAALSRSQAAYLQAKANQSQARATLLQDSVALERTKKLFRENVVSKVDLENAELRFNVSASQYESAQYNVQSAYYQVKSSEATRKQSRQNLDRTNIYASMDGTITQLNVEVGQRVVGTSMMSGTEILKIADLSSMEVVVEINENDIINVGLGDSSKVEVDAFPGKTFYGKVTEIAYSATVAGMATTDQVTNFEVKVKISPRSYENRALELKKVAEGGSKESPFRPGMTALVEIYTKAEKDVVSVPIQAVTLRDITSESGEKTNQEVVFRYANGKVEQVPVVTGINDDTHIHIEEGIEANQRVVIGSYTTLTRRLRNGMEVEEGEETAARRLNGSN